MNIIDRERGLIGCYGIVGGSIAAATGAALTARTQGRVAVAYFGDGATNQAYFFECMNFASVMRLPLIFVCENNLYGEFTPMARVTAGRISDRGAAFNVPAADVDGNDLWAVAAQAKVAIDRARRGGGPTLLECLTYRYHGHSKADPCAYRPAGELEKWKERDPLELARDRFLREGADPRLLDSLQRDAEERVSTAVQAALAAPFPSGLADATEYATL